MNELRLRLGVCVPSGAYVLVKKANHLYATRNAKCVIGYGTLADYSYRIQPFH